MKHRPGKKKGGWNIGTRKGAFGGKNSSSKRLWAEQARKDALKRHTSNLLFQMAMRGEPNPETVKKIEQFSKVTSSDINHWGAVNKSLIDSTTNAKAMPRLQDGSD